MKSGARSGSGQTPTSQEITRLGQEALLPTPAQSSLDVRDKNGPPNSGRQTDLDPTRVCGRDQNPAPHQNSERCQPVRPTVEVLLLQTYVPKEVRPFM